MEIDFLIVGQGLAGSLLGWELSQRGCRIVVVDNGLENASQVAAGLINPVTGLRIAKTPDIDTLLPAAKRYYAALENRFRQTFLIEKPMLRLLRTEKERRSAERRLLEPGYRDYLAGIEAPPPAFYDCLGALRQKQTGYLLTVPLLTALRQYFSERDSYLETALDYREIRFAPRLRWRNLRPACIVFCEGHRGIHNPWFDWLPFQPVKGEILTGRYQGKALSEILNYGYWFIPLPDRLFKTGATFDRERLDGEITAQAKTSLLTELKCVCPSLRTEVVRQQAGIRAATQDRQPFVGRHPGRPELAVFNGFGAKGSLSIPQYCRLFADTLLHRLPLPARIDIKRHHERHFAP